MHTPPAMIRASAPRRVPNKHRRPRRRPRAAGARGTASRAARAPTRAGASRASRGRPAPIASGHTITSPGHEPDDAHEQQHAEHDRGERDRRDRRRYAGAGRSGSPRAASSSQPRRRARRRTRRRASGRGSRSARRWRRHRACRRARPRRPRRRGPSLAGATKCGSAVEAARPGDGRAARAPTIVAPRLRAADPAIPGGLGGAARGSPRWSARAARRTMRAMNTATEGTSSSPAAAAAAPRAPRRYVRREEGKWLAGVCTGMADAFGIDVTVVRVLWVIVACGRSASASPRTLLFWFAFPSEEHPAPISRFAQMREWNSGYVIGLVADRDRRDRRVRLAHVGAAVPPLRRVRVGDPAHRRRRRDPAPPQSRRPTTTPSRRRPSPPGATDGNVADPNRSPTTRARPSARRVPAADADRPDPPAAADDERVDATRAVAGAAASCHRARSGRDGRVRSSRR